MALDPTFLPALHQQSVWILLTAAHHVILLHMVYKLHSTETE